jgi:hypothetical protein
MESQAIEKTQSIVRFVSQTMQTQVHNEDGAKDDSFPQPSRQNHDSHRLWKQTKDEVLKKLFSNLVKQRNLWTLRFSNAQPSMSNHLT